MESKKAHKKAWPKNCPWPEPIYIDRGMEYLRSGQGSWNSWGSMPSLGVHSGNLIPANRDPAMLVRDAIGYEFQNRNLLRQAFTRRAFALEYGLRGCGEELEFLGDAVLNQVVSRELIRQLSNVDKERTDAPFCLDEGVTEGVLSRLRSEYVCKEQLSAQMKALELDGLILYGTGEAPTDSSREDAMEALIGAVAIDSGWNWDALEGVVDKISCIQKEKLHHRAERSYYDRFNAWHKKNFGVMPEYETFGQAPKYYCTLRYFIPENDQNLYRDRREDTDADSRSAAREWAARKAYMFVVSHHLWANMNNAKLTPRLEDSINQLQELYQKKYFESAPVYEFTKLSPEEWKCVCSCDGAQTFGIDVGKTNAKKLAAFDMLNHFLRDLPCPINKYTGEINSARYSEVQLRTANLRILRELAARKDNWDGEGAIAFSKELIAEVASVIRILDHQPTVGPLDLGNMQLEYGNHKSGYYLEIEFAANGLIYYRNSLDEQMKSQRCEKNDIPMIVSEWLKQRDALCKSKNTNQ